MVETEINPVSNALSGEASQLLHWKRNFAANFVDSMFFSLALAFASVNTIVPLFIRQLGGSPLLIGLIRALLQPGHMLAPLFAADCGLNALVLLTWFVRDPRHRQLLHSERKHHGPCDETEQPRMRSRDPG